jgi:histidyl-tRNA synthetase
VKAEEYLRFVKNIKPNETITVIFNYLKKMGYPQDWYAFDPTIARSFAYSTGPIWEIEIPEFRHQSVLGGERFDDLVEKISGLKIPGTGFAVGFDRTLEAAEELGLVPKFTTNSQILVTIFNAEVLDAALSAIVALRAGGVRAELYSDATAKLDKQLKYADRKGIPYVLITGPDEIKHNVVKLKNLKTKEQRELTIEKVIQYLKNDT